MRQLDQKAVKQFNIPETILMENAGESTSIVIGEHIGSKGKSFLILCGIGNNGGDGLVIARKLHSNGAVVVVYIVGDPNKFKGAALINYSIAQKLHIEIKIVHDLHDLELAIASADCVIDALFGTGLDREVSGEYSQIIEQINQYSEMVVSVDIPSGINGDTGQIMGNAVIADITVSYGLPKIGNILFPGFEYGGDLFVTHISFPPNMIEESSLQIETNNPVELPWRHGGAHKGSQGKVLFIAGSANYMGAPYFAAQSFLRAGGGLSYLATTKSVAEHIGARGSEIVFVPLEATIDGSISVSHLDYLLQFSQDVDFVVIGPGLSLNSETKDLVCNITSKVEKPLLIDGDGITAICEQLDILAKRKHPTILTPHPGEMARITSKSIPELEQNPIGLLQHTAKSLKTTIALKGAHTQIGFSDGRVLINLSGNPGMATAGSGDVLTGTIAAMFGMGLSLEEALRMGVFVHGLAGDLASIEIGEDGMIASDIMHYLPAALETLRDDTVDVYANHYNCISVV
jgi:NAD(P)H-hydrate epimerase